jgi:hypothetical protein
MTICNTRSGCGLRRDGEVRGEKLEENKLECVGRIADMKPNRTTLTRAETSHEMARKRRLNVLSLPFLVRVIKVDFVSNNPLEFKANRPPGYGNCVNLPEG